MTKALLKKGQRVRWEFMPGYGFEKEGVVHEDEQEGTGWVSVNWEPDSALNPSCSASCYCRPIGAMPLDGTTCAWILNNLLTEEQLDVIPKGYGLALRYCK